MNITVELAIIALLIFINAFFAAAEIALVSVSEVRMRLLAEQGNRQARMVLSATEDSTRFLATIQVGITLAGFFTSATAATNLANPFAAVLTPALGNAARPVALIGVTVVIAFLSLVLGELVPKRLAIHHAEEISLFAIRPIRWIGKLGAPIVKLLSAITNLILKLTGTPIDAEDAAVSTEEIRAMIDACRAGGSVGEQQRRIIH